MGLELQKDLQTALIQAVLNGHCGAVWKGGEELNEYFSSKAKTTGPQALDYLPPEEGKVREGRESADRCMAASKMQNNNNY